MGSFQQIKATIQPALSKTSRWYVPDSEMHKYKEPFNENVWEHTMSCIKRAEILVNAYPNILRFIDYKKLLQTILLHDSPEGFAIHGDVSQQDPDRERKKAENNEEEVFNQKIIGELGIPSEMIDLYQSYESKSTVEGIIAKLIDRLDARDMWWSNLADGYREKYYSAEKKFGTKMTEYAEFILERFASNNINNPELISILLDYIADFLFLELNLLPSELQDREREEIIEAKNQLLTES